MRLHRVHRGVYAVGHRDLSSHGRCLAAVFACGRGAVVSHASAAWLWGLLPSLPTVVDVSVPSNGRSHPGIALRHSATLRGSEIGTLARIPVTALARTLLDVAATGRPRDLNNAVERAERLGLLDMGAIDAIQLRRRGARGAARLRAASEIYRDPVFSRARSERLFVALVREAGLPPPSINLKVAGFEIDGRSSSQTGVASGAISVEGGGQTTTVLARRGVGLIAFAEDADRGAAQVLPGLALGVADRLEEAVQRRLALTAVERRERVDGQPRPGQADPCRDPLGGEVLRVPLDRLQRLVLGAALESGPREGDGDVGPARLEFGRLAQRELVAGSEQLVGARREERVEEGFDLGRRDGADEFGGDVPSRKAFTAGIPWIPKPAASCGLASASTLASTTLPARAASAPSSAGPSWRQGPHHSAQKSTTTGIW